MKTEKVMEVTTEYLEALRKAAGLQIDPETAQVHWKYAQTLDPYGDDPNLPEECQQVGREYFARSPKSDVWVWFADLPAAALRAAGHEPGSLLHVIREKCLDCCCGQAAEVRRCTAHHCALWPYRLASNPFLRGRTNAGSFGAKNHSASREISAPNSQPADLLALSS